MSSEMTVEEMNAFLEKLDKDTKEIQVVFDKENSGELKGENINSIIEQMRKRTQG